jgi:nitrate reductase cytochrome c-type subunit
MKLPNYRKHLVFIWLLTTVSSGNISRAETGEAGLATGQPGMNTYPVDQPGETVPLGRPYGIAPPVIPHDVTDLEVSRSANDCVECHLDGMELGEGHVATKVPASHYKNEFTGETAEEMVIGIRYNCLQCHVPQATMKPGM